jgi:hypothetical protein
MLDRYNSKAAPGTAELDRSARSTLSESCKLVRESRAIIRDLERMLLQSRRLLARYAAARDCTAQ